MSFNKILVYTLHLFFIILFPVHSISEQLPSETTESSTLPADAQELNDLFVSLESLILAESSSIDIPMTTDINLISRLFKEGAEEKESISDIKLLLNKSRSDLAGQDLGLSIAGYYTTKVVDGAIEDGRDGSDYSGYVGLEWDILSDGYLENRRKSLTHVKEAEINRTIGLSLSKQERFSDLYYYVIYVFNFAKIEKLKERLDYLDNYIKIARKLYFYKRFLWEDIIKLEQERAETEVMLRNCVNYNKEMADRTVYPIIDADRLPVPEVNLRRLLDSAKKNDGDNILGMQREKNNLEYSLLNDIQLRLFLRYYTSETFSSSAQDGISMGLNFRVPLPLKPKGTSRDIISLEERLIELNLKQDASKHVNQVQDTYYEYEYKLKDIVTFNFKRQLLEERLSKERIKRDLGDKNYSPLPSLFLADAISATEVEYLDIKQQVYLKLLELYKLTSGNDILDILRIPEGNKKVRKYKGNRSIYIWSQTFNRQENEFLVSYMKSQEVNTVMLSFSEETELTKIKDFVNKSRVENISVMALFGDNSLIMPDKRGKLKFRIEDALDSGLSWIHLDVEPHTFSDWHERKDEYLALYIEMLGYIRELRPELNIAVSLPVFLPEEYLKDIFNRVDRVTLMAYETDDVGVVGRRIREETSLGSEKVEVAIRTKDFSHRAGLEEFIGDLMNSTGIEYIAIHDLEGLLGFEQLNMNLY